MKTNDTYCHFLTQEEVNALRLWHLHQAYAPEYAADAEMPARLNHAARAVSMLAASDADVQAEAERRGMKFVYPDATPESSTTCAAPKHLTPTGVLFEASEQDLIGELARRFGRIVSYDLNQTPPIVDGLLREKLRELGWIAPDGQLFGDKAGELLREQLIRLGWMPPGMLTERERQLATDPCQAKRRPDEPAFTLLGRDPVAASLIRLWAAAREALPQHGGKSTPADRLADARTIAKHCWGYATDTPGSKPVDVLDVLPLNTLGRAIARRGYTVRAVSMGSGNATRAASWLPPHEAMDDGDVPIPAPGSFGLEC